MPPATVNPVKAKATFTAAIASTAATASPSNTAAAASHPDYQRSWLRRLWPVAQLQWRTFCVCAISGLISIAATVAVPIAIGRGVEAAAAGDALWPPVATLAGLAVVRFCFGFITRFGLFRSANRIEADLRSMVYQHLTRLSYSYWDRTQTSQVISRANSDIHSIQLIFAFAPVMLIQAVMLVMGVAAMLTLSVTLTAVAMLPLPLVVYNSLQLRSRVMPLSQVTQARLADLAGVVDENIQGAHVVRAFAQEHSQVRKLAQAARRLRWVGTATAKARARYSPVMSVLPRLGLAFVLLVGGLAAIDQQVSVGDVVAFNAYVLIMASPFRIVGFILVQWQRAATASQRVFAILDEEPEIVEPANAVRLSFPIAGKVELQNVTFTYPGSSEGGVPGRESDIGDGDSGDDGNDNAGGGAVLNGMTLTIEPGETVALVGRSGSGKSTIARLLPRFYDVNSGVVRLDGTDVRDINLHDLRRAVVVVTEEPFLFASSVYENVAFAGDLTSNKTLSALTLSNRTSSAQVSPNLTSSAMTSPNLTSSVDEALADASAKAFVSAMELGEETLLTERGGNLSGGQRQRIALARALFAEPSVLVLDDALSAVDVATERLIYEALERRHGKLTTIIITHRESTMSLVDNIVFVANGINAAAGSHSYLLRAEPQYAEMLAQLHSER